MGVEETVFLTLEEACEAVCIDFEQYGAQADQLSRTMAILGVERGVPLDEPAGGVVRSLFALHQPDPDQLRDICTEVFWTRAQPGRGPGGEAGLLIATDMERFSCNRCGVCCLSLDFHRECSVDDVALWRKLGRRDILEWVGLAEDGGYRIWMRPDTGLMAEICPWLTQEGSGCWTCSIHDCKPEVCREYPGSRKHACRTGCPTARARCAL